MLDFETCDRARLRRDPAYDGLFFCAVRTTGVYCRPICRVKPPLSKNVHFYPTAAAAEADGYRPCFRCRPESAPFCPAWMGTRTTVTRGLRMIQAGDLDRNTVQSLSQRLGVGVRHLSRLFVEHIGASPLQVAKTLRVQRAKRLLNETNCDLSDVAVRSGFPSRRSMASAFSSLYGRTPSDVRKIRFDGYVGVKR